MPHTVVNKTLGKRNADLDGLPAQIIEHPLSEEELNRLFPDGYKEYHKPSKERPDLLIGGCWIHARRPFADFIKSIKGSADGTIAHKAYSLITEILHIDNGFDDLPSDDRLKQRQLILTEKVDAYFKWVKLKYNQVTHNSTIGKALAYSIHQEPYLQTFLTDGDIPMDNNYAEQAIRPFTSGRKKFRAN